MVGFVWSQGRLTQACVTPADAKLSFFTGSTMPIYAYKCASCGHAKDVLQKISDAPLSTCPFCGAEAFGKQLTAAGFQLKGSGWYVTDFKGGSAGAGAGATATASAEPAAASSDTASSAPSTPCGGSCACH